MRDLKPQEKKDVLEKLNFFIGDNVNRIIDEKNKIVLHNQRVMLVSEKVKAATSMIPRKCIAIAGTVLGKFTKTGKFRLRVSSLHILSRYAIHRVWIKSSAEMCYLYGNNSLKSHVFRLSEGIPQNAGVVVYNQNDVPLGFGVTSLSAQAYSAAKGHALVLLRQVDAGLYIRDEVHAL
ncbi:ribosomal biogenesis protein [Ordospora colligata]|uniref:60S ribosome subunit biogenesis protein NIP7 n=1 Tax=Ordospora colligata OC4 TaxID=1354746 RepID=A0A0B2UKU9_9MICR|nr:ribosomal biogenesis protein [Ordospora colligata OC4]KHN69652.1 ribosomal biogenesis protein [Ordospora colligata OC4]TBU15771.1 ribosomal biogenesis protein [Ordospora colligata]TBU15899.1 ribosomal biogenesis protein [Ordospora colligata]TBU18793.1 ribosomal biogenesis protein [Ordospora colligata]